MIVTKRTFKFKGEHVVEPTWLNEEHAELVRVKPDFNFSMSQILQRFQAGIQDVGAIVGKPDLPVDPNQIPFDDVDTILDMSDIMDTNINELPDVENFAKTIGDSLNNKKNSSELNRGAQDLDQIIENGSSENSSN